MKPNMFNIEDVYYCKPIRNKIMNGGMFMRIIYSNSMVSINGIHIVFSISGKIHEVYNNKYKFAYDTVSPDILNIINNLECIEKKILSSCSLSDKTPSYKLKDQLEQKFFKFFQSSHYVKPSGKQSNNSSTIFSLKISGVWSTETTYGITYKFTKV
jgi:hypothetical protein